MILSCPSCTRRFLLDAGLLGTGRRVKCGNCGHIWYQEPPPPEKPAAAKQAAKPAKPKTAAPAAPPPPPPPPEMDDSLFGDGSPGGFSSYLDDDPGPARSEDVVDRIRSRSVPALVEEPKPARWKAALPWAGLAASIALVGFGLVSGRDSIVAAWPAANGFYEVVGMPVEPLGAGLEPVYTAEFREVEGNPMLFVAGEIRNNSDKVREVPNIVATAIDPDGKAVQTWLIVPSARSLSPRQSTSFSSVQPEGASPAKEIALVFQAPAPAR